MISSERIRQMRSDEYVEAGRDELRELANTILRQQEEIRDKQLRLRQVFNLVKGEAV